MILSQKSITMFIPNLFAKNVRNHGTAYISGVTWLFNRCWARIGSWYLCKSYRNASALYREKNSSSAKKLVM